MTSQIQIKFPADGWGISIEKAPHFARVEMNKHVARWSKNIGAGVHLSLPIGLAKAKTYLQDDYLHDTVFKLITHSATFFTVPNAFTVLKET